MTSAMPKTPALDKRLKSLRPPTKPIRVGRYVMFDTPLTICLDPVSSSSSVTFDWRKDGYVLVAVGASRSLSWSCVVDGLLHELMEFAIRNRGCHFTPNTGLSDNSCGQFFMAFDHAQFTSICRHVGDVLACCLPVLGKKWGELERLRNRRRK